MYFDTLGPFCPCFDRSIYPVPTPLFLPPPSPGAYHLTWKDHGGPRMLTQDVRRRSSTPDSHRLEATVRALRPAPGTLHSDA